jgi:hypothetical protein
VSEVVCGVHAASVLFSGCWRRHGYTPPSVSFSVYVARLKKCRRRRDPTRRLQVVFGVVFEFEKAPWGTSVSSLRDGGE